MKEIYLRVKVPDGSPEINKAMVGSDDGYFHISNDVTEIQLPSEEEIIQNEHLITDEYENASKDQKWFMGVGFRLCATWLLNKLKGK